MQKKEIGYILQHYRQLSGLSVRQVAMTLKTKHNINVSEKTIYGWENSQSFPSTYKFLILCEMYNITDITAAFLGKNHPSRKISREEIQLVLSFRKHQNMQDAVRLLLNMSNPDKI